MPITEIRGPMQVDENFDSFKVCCIGSSPMRRELLCAVHENVSANGVDRDLTLEHSIDRKQK
jgi:hypothetical protein